MLSCVVGLFGTEYADLRLQVMALPRSDERLLYPESAESVICRTLVRLPRGNVMTALRRPSSIPGGAVMNMLDTSITDSEQFTAIMRNLAQQSDSSGQT